MNIPCNYALKVQATVRKLLKKQGILKNIKEYGNFSSTDDININCDIQDNDEYTGVDVEIQVNGDYICSFKLVEMPGCCGIGIVTELYVSDYRRIGLGTLLHKIALDMLRESGFSMALCTDTASNTPSIKILEKFGWKESGVFVNKRTKNKVKVFNLDLKKSVMRPVKKKVAKKAAVKRSK